MKHLVFQLAAPLMSWGNEMAREERPSDGHPRKSAILGLLGAALGKPRSDPWHGESARTLGFATVVLRPGVRMIDYHTVATPEGTKSYESRRDEAEVSDYTVQTLREYLSDAYFLVALWNGTPADLEKYAHFLEEPVWTPYAGRKCCSLSLPFAPQVLDTSTLEEAFQAYRLYEPLVPEEAEFSIYWERHPATQLVSTSVSARNDALISREKKLFRTRDEYQGTLHLERRDHVSV